MTPRQFLSILAARWKVVALAWILVVAGTTAVSLKLFKQYSASASVMLDARSPDQIAGGAVNGIVPAGYMATQVDLIQSERVARGVIKALHMDQDPALREAWQEVSHGVGDFEAWLSEELQKKLVVKPAPVSNVITIGYSARSGARAAEIANAFLDSYIDISLELRMERVRQYDSFFDERAKDLRSELEAARAKLSEYQRKNGLLVGDDRLDVEASRLAELSSQMVQLQGTSAEIAGRQQQALRQPDQLPEVVSNPAVVALTADLSREEIRLRELTSRLGESHPQLVEQNARVADLKARLAAATVRASGSVGVSNSVSQARLAQISSSLEQQRVRVLRLQGLKEQAMVLQRDVDNAQRAYDAMRLRVNQSSIESQNTYTNVTLLKRATVPMEPTSPNVPKNVAAGVAAGLLLGILAAVALEMRDRRMRTIDDVAELKQPLLVSIPVAAHALRAASTSRSRLIKQRVLTGLPGPRQVG